MENKIVTNSGMKLARVCTGLEKEVKVLIDAGWKPLGGISISEEKVGDSIYYTLIQSMLKE